jgi:hypothetical protein
MKRILWLMVALFLATMVALGFLAFAIAPVQAATLQINGTVPSLADSLGNCTIPTLTRIPSGTLLTLHVLWWPAGGDSLNAAQDSLVALVPGALFQLTKQVPSALYRIRAFASVLPSLPGCDTTITKLVRGPAWKVVIQ